MDDDPQRGAGLVGDEGSTAARTIAVHAAQQLNLQREALDQLERAVRHGRAGEYVRRNAPS